MLPEEMGSLIKRKEILKNDRGVFDADVVVCCKKRKRIDDFYLGQLNSASSRRMNQIQKEFLM